MSDTTDPSFWSKKIAREGVTSSFLRPEGGQKSGILERGFWPGDRVSFGPHRGKTGFIAKVKNLFSGAPSSGLGEHNPGLGDVLKPWTWFSKPSLLKSIDLRTRRGGPSTVPRADQGKKIWALYNAAQKKQHFGGYGDPPVHFQRPGFIDRGGDYERPGFITDWF